MHIVAFAMLLLPRIYKFCVKMQSQKINLKSKIMAHFKFTDEPIVYEIISCSVLFMYVAVLFAALNFYYSCEVLVGRAVIFDWIRIEMVIFFSNIIGIAVFLFGITLMSRLNIKMKFEVVKRNDMEKQTDILKHHYWPSFIVSMSVINLLTSIHVYIYLCKTQPQ